VVVIPDEIAQLAEAGRDGFEHGGLAGAVQGVRVLRHARDARAGLAPQDACIRHEVAGKHLQQAGFAFAVPAEHGDALARLNSQ
jgi:hypothetical protein